MSEWKKETFRQALEDERELIRIVLNCVSGQTSLTYETIRTNIHRMLMNYHVNVDIASKVCYYTLTYSIIVYDRTWIRRTYSGSQ